MSDQNIFHPVHTPCKLCTFAKYDNKTQLDCHLGFIEKYKNHNIEIIEAYDEEKEFYVINGKKCFGYKEDNYFKSRGLENSDIKEKIKYVKSKLSINYLCSINIIKFSLEELQELLSSINNLQIKPKMIILVRYQDDNKIYQYQQLKKLLDNYASGIKWKIQTITDKEQTYVQVLDMITKNNRHNNFVLSIDGDYTGVEKIITYAQNCVYEKFKIFKTLSNISNSVVFYNSIVYRTGIFHGINILDKKEEYEIP